MPKRNKSEKRHKRKSAGTKARARHRRFDEARAMRRGILSGMDTGTGFPVLAALVATLGR